MTVSTYMPLTLHLRKELRHSVRDKIVTVRQVTFLVAPSFKEVRVNAKVWDDIIYLCVPRVLPSVFSYREQGRWSGEGTRLSLMRPGFESPDLR